MKPTRRFFASNHRRYDLEGFRDLQREAIEETNQFLNWALSKDRGLPRIPTARVDHGGFEKLLEMTGSRDLVENWWNKILERTTL